MILPDLIDDGVSEEAREVALQSAVAAMLADRNEVADMLDDIDVSHDIAEILRVFQRCASWVTVWPEIVRPAERMHKKFRALAEERAKAAAERVA